MLISLEWSLSTSVRVASEDGSMVLDLDSNGAIATMSIQAPNNAVGKRSRHTFASEGGFALREYPSADASCGISSTGGPLHSTNLLSNGDFSMPGDSPGAAAHWDPALKGVGYTRVTGSAVTRANHTASISVVTTHNTDIGGAEQVWKPPTGSAQHHQLRLSGWSKSDADSGGVSSLDYSLYADVAFADGTWSFGHAARFSPSAHDWEHACTVITLNKPVMAVYVYALYRYRVGRVYFDSVVLAPLRETPMTNGSAVALSPNNSLAVRGQFVPSGWKQTGTLAALAASFTGHRDHIRVAGTVVMSHASNPRSLSRPRPTRNFPPPADRAVSLQIAFPLAGEGWHLWMDPSTFVTLTNDGHMHSGPTSSFPHLPHPVDRYPMLVLTSPDGSTGVMLAIPMEPTVFLYRTAYDAARQLLLITFDFGLTARSTVFPSMASFSCLLFPLANPAWGFRGALQQYYETYPGVWGREDPRRIRQQGLWVTCVHISTLDRWEDFGITFAEVGCDGYNVSEYHFMNDNQIMVFPYIEPHLIHFPLPKGVSATWENINKTVTTCAADAQAPCHRAGKMIVDDAVVGSDGRWVYGAEHDPWNDGAMFIAGLDPSTLADPFSRATQEMETVEQAYHTAVASGYRISGQYVDSTLGFNSEFSGYFNYRASSVATTQHPPVFDAAGRVAVLSVQSEFSFLEAVAQRVRARGQYQMGNSLWVSGTPNYNFPQLFDIAGTEIDWQAEDQASRAEHGVFTPPPVSDMLFARAMSGCKPYIYLLDTNFDTWTADYTDQYFQISLVFGIWPSFFSANAATSVYFNNRTLLERDRPYFKKYIPTLRKINYAGWEPVTFANASGIDGSSFMVERFGGVDSGTIYFTLRRRTIRNATSTHSAAPQPAVMTVYTKALGMRATNTTAGYNVTEIAQATGMKVGPLVVSEEASTSNLYMSDIADNTTYVLSINCELGLS